MSAQVCKSAGPDLASHRSPQLKEVPLSLLEALIAVFCELVQLGSNLVETCITLVSCGGCPRLKVVDSPVRPDDTLVGPVDPLVQIVDATVQ